MSFCMCVCVVTELLNMYLSYFFTYFVFSHAIPIAVITCTLEIVKISDDAIYWLQATF